MPPYVVIRRHFAFVVYLLAFLSLLSHFWFAIPQLVLQADWQDVWHSPQPPFFALSQRLRVLIVLICFIVKASVKFNIFLVLYHAKRPKVNSSVYWKYPKPISETPFTPYATRFLFIISSTNHKPSSKSAVAFP